MIARLVAALVAGAAFLCAGAGTARADDLLCVGGSGCRADALSPSPVAAPDGAHPVGRVDAALTAPDRSRAIMVSVWYPAARAGAPAAYIPAADPVAQSWIAVVSAQWLHTPVAAIAMVGATIGATEGAPVDTSLGRLPVVIVSPGLGTPRFILSGLATDLASRGYVAVTMDHTGESPAVEFPGGRITFGDRTRPYDAGYMSRRLADRLDDTRLALDRLPTLPIVGPLVDLGRIAMAGHSYGGLTAVQTMSRDPRVRAAVVLDGPAGWSEVAATPVLDRPVLLLSAGDMVHESWKAFRDPRFELASVTGAGHYVATDLPALGGGTDLCGIVPADRAATVTRGTVTGWLDRHLLDRDIPRPAYPELIWHHE